MPEIITNYTTDDLFRTNEKDRKFLVSHLNTAMSVDGNLRSALNTDPLRHPDIADGHSRSTTAILAAVRDGRCLVSPLRFTPRFGICTAVTADQIIGDSDFGLSVERDLYSTGLIDELTDNGGGKRKQERHIRLILASLCLSTHGAASLKDLGAERLASWLALFRTPDRLRWRDDVWGKSALHYHLILRRISIALDRIFPAFGFAQLSGNTRVGTSSLLLKSQLENPEHHLLRWKALFVGWREYKSTTNTKDKRFFARFLLWLSQYRTTASVASPVEFLSERRDSPSFAEFIGTLRKEGEAGEASGIGVFEVLKTAVQFSDYVERTVSQQTDHRIYPIVTPAQIDDAERRLKAAGKRETRTRTASLPLPEVLYQMAKTILQEGETGWPAKCRMCWVLIGSERVYCPVYPTLFLALYEIPIRVVQMKRLDSGEGDDLAYHPANDDWSRNLGEHRSYWSRIKGGDGLRGFARKLPNSKVTGIFINTNKTGKPYTIPWQNRDLHVLLHELRSWQEKHFPIHRPLKPDEYLKDGDEITPSALAKYPDIFPLFRLPAATSSSKLKVRIPSERDTNVFWQYLIEEVQRRYNQLNPEHPIQIVKRPEGNPNGQPYGAVYKPHGMRSAGLTRLYKAGVPVDVLSEMVAGHASLLMTLYYMIRTPQELHALMEAGRVKMEQMAASSLVLDAKLRGIFPLPQFETLFDRSYLDWLKQASGTQRLLFTDMDIGMCPWEHKRCSDGGPKVRQSSANGEDNSTYAPVEGGPRNCILCRHFVTGPAWQVPLWIYGTRLCRRLSVDGARMAELDDEVDGITRSLQQAAPSELSAMRVTVDRLEQARARLGAERELTAKALANVYRLLEQIASVRDDVHGDETVAPDAVIVQPNSSHVQWIEVSQFEQAAFLQKMGRLYPSLYDEESETASMKLADQICYASNYSPISLLPLTQSQKIRALEDFNSILLQRMKREELIELETGVLRLDELEGIDVIRADLTKIGTPLRPSVALRSRVAGKRGTPLLDA